MDDTKAITERRCLAAALTLLIKAGEIDEVQTFELMEKDGFEGLYNILNARFKEAYISKV